MLSKTISSLPLEHVLWLTPSGPVTVREALQMARSQIINNFLNKRVAIYLCDNESLVKTISSIDGVAESALLIPQGLNTEARQTMVSKFSPDVFITSENELDCSFSDIPCIYYSTLSSGASQLAEEIRQPELSTRWVLPTSGTTGPPKLVAHSIDSLSRSINKAYLKGRNYRWGLLFDVTRFAGTQVFLQSLFAGSTLVIPDQGDDLEGRITFFINAGVNACSATPTMWRRLLMLPRFRELKLKQITLGGEISDQHVLSTLKQIFPEARIVHIYASTEAGVGFSISDAICGFPKSFISDPPPGIQLRINENGILCIKSNTTTDQQYLGEPGSLYDNDGFIDTGDVVTLKGDRYHFLGRVNGAINVGGNKVHPEEIEAVAVGFPGVRMAHAYGKKSAFVGNVVAIDLSLDSSIVNIPEFKGAFLDYCSTKLADFKIPASIRFVDDVSSNLTGKISRGSK